MIAQQLGAPPGMDHACGLFAPGKPEIVDE
jgi:hypothetical protein